MSARESFVTRWLRTAPPALFALYGGGAAFAAYFAMYAFRKPFTAASYVHIPGWPFAIDFKVVIVIAQVAGYALSKILGIKVVSEMPPAKRCVAILLLIGLSELALVGFAILPPVTAVAGLFLNGLALGMIWGLVFGFLEGRRLTEVLGAMLCATFILASGVVKSVGETVLQNAWASERWISGSIGAWVSVRKGALEKATLSILQLHLLTEDHARLFADEFRREMVRLTSTSVRQDQSAIERLAVVTREIDTLAVNMLVALASPALLKLLANRESEKARLEGQLGTPTTVAPSAMILLHPELLQLFDEKVGRLRKMVDAETVRGEAAEILSTLIESVTIYPEGPHGPAAEVVAKVSDLMAFAKNDNAAREGGVVV